MNRPHREFDEAQWRAFEDALRREARRGVLMWVETTAPDSLTIGQLRVLLLRAGSAVGRVFDDARYPDGRRWPEFESQSDATPTNQHQKT